SWKKSAPAWRTCSDTVPVERHQGARACGLSAFWRTGKELRCLWAADIPQAVPAGPVASCRVTGLTPDMHLYSREQSTEMRWTRLAWCIRRVRASHGRTWHAWVSISRPFCCDG